MNPFPDSTRRRLAITTLAGLILLVMLPNAVWLLLGHGTHPLIDAVTLPIASLLMLFAVFGGRLWIACMLLLPFAVLAPLEAFYIDAYHRPSFAEIIATLIATNSREMREYLGSMLLPLVACVTAAALLPLLAAWWSRHSGLHLTARARAWFGAIAVAAPLAIGIAAGVTAKGDGNARWHAGVEREIALGDEMQYGYPFGLIQRFVDYRREWDQMRANVARLDSFHFDAHRAAAFPHRQVYVLVIGEASRRDHWHLFGYDRPTTPKLELIKNLIPFKDLDTPWPESITAIPIILTRKPITETKFTWFKEASILRAMHEAGYETYWISNQQAIGKYDSPVSTYAFEADHELFLNHSSWSVPGSYDEVLLQSLRDVLHDSDHDLFIVLHMMGNHQSYDFRYPDAFKRYRPTESDPNEDSSADDSSADSGSDDSDSTSDDSDDDGDDASTVARSRNSYDNSILYTDHVLASIIDILHANGTVTALWFESDHGESLPTATCSLEGHGNGTHYEYEIPALVWYSDSWAAAFPQRLSTLRANAGKRLLSADTFESLIDMAGVDFPGHDPTWSVFSPLWHYRPRIINRPSQGDIDTATFSKDCGVVHPRAVASARPHAAR